MTTDLSSSGEGHYFRSSGPVTTKARSSAGKADGNSSSALDCSLGHSGFDKKLAAVVGKSLQKQKAAIRQIVKTEPAFTETFVIGRLVNRMLKYASHLGLEKREATIQKVLELDPSLKRDEVIEKVNQLAMTSLPAWTSSSFWSRNIDPILLRAIANANQELEAAASQIQAVYPDLTRSQICDRHARYRTKQADARFNRTAEASDWPCEADRLLRAAISAEIKAERDATRHVLKNFPEVRRRAIEQRLNKLRRRFPTNCGQRYQRLAWSLDIDTRLRAAADTESLQGVVAQIAAEFGCSRECVYRHCKRLGIPRRQRQPVKPWTIADIRYVLNYVNQKSPQRIAEALGRSCSAVVQKVQEFGTSTSVSKYSLRDLRRDLHVHHSTIMKWIHQGKLQIAIKQRTLRKGHPQHIREEDLVEFLGKYRDELDLTKVEPNIRVLMDEFLIRPALSNYPGSPSRQNS